MIVSSSSRYFGSGRNFVERPAGLALGIAIAAVLAVVAQTNTSRGASLLAVDPWNNDQLIQPQQLATELARPTDSRPRVVCVGFKFLYESGHVPGTAFYGPAREAAGLHDLETAAKAWPRDREVVIYCGCCPLKQCPNVRPAFAALKAMGFTRLRLLDLDTDFRTDWKGLPVEKTAPAQR
jgi:thiosulfate/3-mercaptopyruvate sulfurtransferase